MLNRGESYSTPDITIPSALDNVSLLKDHNIYKIGSRRKVFLGWHPFYWESILYDVCFVKTTITNNKPSFQNLWSGATCLC